MQENPLLTIRAAQHIGQGLELKILIISIITNDITVAVHGLCCIVTVLQVKKPDLTVNTIERCAREQRKVANVQSIVFGLFQYVFGR
jgi:hypothetical protein